jgi:hypothetical protein
MWQETQRIFLESAAEVLGAAARLLPRVLAMLLFFALSAALAVAARAAVRRACEHLDLDRRVRAWGLASAGDPGGIGASRLAARVAFWAVLAGGAVLGLSVLPTAATTALSVQLLAYGPRLLLAVVILAAASGLSRIVERNVLIGAVNMGMQSARLLSLGARWLVVLLGGAIGLEHAGVGTGVLAIAFGSVFGGIVLALALAVGLGARDLVARSLLRRFPEVGANGASREPAPGAQIRHL